VTRSDDRGVRSRAGVQERRRANRRVRARGRARGERRARPLASAAGRKPKRTVVRVLKRMRRTAAIDDPTFAARREAYRSARAFTKGLDPGRRRIEMAGVIALMERMARDGTLTVSRLAPIWLTLERNRQWWSEGPLLASGRRVGFEGSEMLWQYVPGQGVQIHPLANFGKLNALWRTRGAEARVAVLLDEMLAVAAERAGGIAWEYYFDFGGGRGPWVSAIAQGTGLQAIARAATLLGRQAEVLPFAQRGLAVFETAAPDGVREPVADGAHYLMYSFNPRLRILNGFVQALVGLYDWAEIAGDDRARALFADGDRAAQREVPEYDTGAWSLYSRLAVTRESSLSYHNLVIDFLRGLCSRTQAPVYCETRRNFRRYLREAPEVAVVSRRLRGGTTSPLKIELSKISDVGVRVLRGDQVVFSRAAQLGQGRRHLSWSVPRRRGEYQVIVTATDLAGNTSSYEGFVEVLAPRKRKRR